MLFGSKNIKEFEKTFDKFLNNFSDDELLNKLKTFSTNYDKELEERLKEIREHFSNITSEELDKNLELCGINDTTEIDEFKYLFFSKELYGE